MILFFKRKNVYIYEKNWSYGTNNLTDISLVSKVSLKKKNLNQSIINKNPWAHPSIPLTSFVDHFCWIKTKAMPFWLRSAGQLGPDGTYSITTSQDSLVSDPSLDFEIYKKKTPLDSHLTPFWYDFQLIFIKQWNLFLKKLKFLNTFDFLLIILLGHQYLIHRSQSFLNLNPQILKNPFKSNKTFFLKKKDLDRKTRLAKKKQKKKPNFPDLFDFFFWFFDFDFYKKTINQS